MSFNPTNLTFVNVVGGVAYFTYTTSDMKGDVKGGSNYFPYPLVRVGDVVIVTASDGDMVIIQDGSPGGALAVEIVAF